MTVIAIKDTFISKNDKPITKLTSPYQDKLDTVNDLFGCISNTIKPEESKKERL